MIYEPLDIGVLKNQCSLSFDFLVVFPSVVGVLYWACAKIRRPRGRGTGVLWIKEIGREREREIRRKRTEDRKQSYYI